MSTGELHNIFTAHATTSEDKKTINLFGMTSFINSSVSNANCKLEATIKDQYRDVKFYFTTRDIKENEEILVESYIDHDLISKIF